MPKKIVLLILLVFIVYSNTFDNAFVWDDTKLIAENVKVHYLKYVPQLFTRDYFDRATAPSHNGLAQQYWRPLVLLSFSLDYFFWGRNPLGYHLTSVALHAFNAILVLIVLGMVPKTRPVSWYAALIFALHPLNTNAVAFISGRTDLLAATFFLLACAAFLRYVSTERSGRLAVIGMALCLSLSLTAKESFMIAPLLLLLLGAYAAHRSKRRIEGTLCVSIAILAAFFLYRAAVDIPLGDLRAALRRISVRTLLAAAESVVLYGRLFLLPTGLYLDRFMPLPSSITPGALSLACLLAAAIPMAARSLFHRNPNGFFAFWFLAALLPVSNVIPIYPGLAAAQLYVGEHLLYLPAIGLAGLLASTWLAASNRRIAASSIIRAAGASVLIIFGILTYAHNEYWRDELTFYERTVRKSPGSSRMLLNLGMSYAQQKRYDEAAKTIAGALRLNPDWAIAHNGLGVVYAMKGDTDAARMEFKRAVELDPWLAAAHCNLGMTAANAAEAEGHYKKAVEISPAYTAARIKLAAVYMGQGGTDKAIGVLNDALYYDPRSLEARADLAAAYEKARRYKEAAEQYRLIASWYPGCASAVEKMREMEGKAQSPML